jgi:hypothetical protein
MAAKDTTPALLDTLAEVVPHERLNRKTYETGKLRQIYKTCIKKTHFE